MKRSHILQGAVKFFGDDDLTEPSPETRSTALACLELLRRQQKLRPGDSHRRMILNSASRLPGMCPISRFGRHSWRCVRKRTASRYLINYFPEYLANQKRSIHVRKVAVTNGHGYIAMGKKPE